VTRWAPRHGARHIRVAVPAPGLSAAAGADVAAFLPRRCSASPASAPPDTLELPAWVFARRRLLRLRPGTRLRSMLCRSSLPLSFDRPTQQSHTPANGPTRMRPVIIRLAAGNGYRSKIREYGLHGGAVDCSGHQRADDRIDRALYRRILPPPLTWETPRWLRLWGAVRRQVHPDQAAALATA
jgi:hypothetical protein